MKVWMSSKDFSLIWQRPDSYESFLKHLGQSPRWQFIVMKFFFFLSFVPLLRSFPLWKFLCLTTQKLFSGYLSEQGSEFRTVDSTPKPKLFKDSDSKVFDYVIVGSGPGAATSFINLPKHSSVLVLEKGLYARTSLESHHTLRHVLLDFDKGGKEAILASGFPQFAQGSVIGGGSQVNSGLYHRLPEEKRAIYQEISNLSDSNWASSELEIEGLLKIEKMSVDENLSLIANSAKAMGFEYINVPRWRSYGDNNHFEHFGMKEVVWDTGIGEFDHRVIPGVQVTSLNNSKTQYVEVKAKTRDGTSLVFKGNQVIVSAGPVSTPYLLAKSSLVEWRNVHMQWHPMIRRIVRTNPDFLGLNDIDPFQSWTDGKHFKFGSAVSTKGLLGVGLNKIISDIETRHLRSYYISFASSGRGGLIPATQRPWYVYSTEDKQSIIKGARLLGAFLRASNCLILNENQRNLSTVHIFGSLPLGSNIYLPGTNRLKSDSRIMVADSSLLPLGPSVNPQGPVMTLVNALMKRELR